MMSFDPRRLCLESLIKSEKNRSFSNLEVNSAISAKDLSEKDKSFFTALFYGVVERKITLDHIIDLLSSRKDLSQKVRNLLRMGIYQILYMDKVPDSAAVDEAVKLAKSIGEYKASGLINGILRNLCRNRADIRKRLDREDDAQALSIKYSYPVWMVEMWISCYGLENAKAIMSEQNKKAPLTLRVNTLKTDKEAVISSFEGKVIQYPSVPTAVTLTTHFNPSKSKALENGEFFIQDLASQTAIKHLSPQKGERLIDCCCCPGGKSFSAAIEMENQGEIKAFDLHQSKLGLVDKGAKRLGITIIKTAVGDATKFNDTLKEWADKIICDVPCSGLGVISKKPDIRDKKLEDISRLPEIQRSILDNVTKYLKKGGRLLYSTCTLNSDENENITNAFLKENKRFKRPEGYPITIMPKENEQDGFFIDIIEKTE